MPDKPSETDQPLSNPQQSIDVKPDAATAETPVDEPVAEVTAAEKDPLGSPGEAVVSSESGPDDVVSDAAEETQAQPRNQNTSVHSQLPLTIDLLRHGKVATPSMFSAPFEEPLGMEGWKQLTLATQDTEWDVVIAPPIRRCHDFARLLARRLGCEFRVDEQFCELNFGEWIGLSQQEILARDPELLQQYYFQPRRFHAPGGESMELFMDRVHRGWDEMLASCAGKRVLILTHTGVIRVLLGKALDLLYQKTLRFEVDYARFSRLSVYPDGEIVLSGHGLADVRQL